MIHWIDIILKTDKLLISYDMESDKLMLIKRFLSITTSLLILFCITIPASAQGTDMEQVISFDYFYSTLKAEYAKYNINYEIERSNENFVYTVGFLNDQLALANEFCKGITIEVKDVIQKGDTSSLKPASMLTDFLWYKDVNISSDSVAVPGMAKFKVICSGVVDLQNGIVISHEEELREMRTTNVAESNLRVETSMSSSGAIIYVVLDGNIKFSWTDPYAGMTSTTTIYGPFIDTSFRADNYLA